MPSEPSEPACAPSPSVNPTDIAAPSSPRDGPAFHASPTFATLRQTDWLGSDPSISPAEESPVSPQASPEAEEDPSTTAGYGPRTLTLFNYLAPRSPWRKILSDSLASSLTDWRGLSGHFETSVLMHGPSLSPLTMWVPHTLGDESGSLLPTPSASSYGTNQGGAAGRVGPVRPSLETMARHNLWPTPQAYSHSPGVSVPGLTPLDIAVRPELQHHGERARERKNWPTPTAGDSKSSGSRNTSTSQAHFGVSLTDAIRGDQGSGRIRGEQKLSARAKLMPTPSANDHKGSAKEGQRRRQLTDPAMGVIPRGGGGSLNPTWVEWLMGFPLGWTALEPSEMPASRRSSKRSRARSQRQEKPREV